MTLNWDPSSDYTVFDGLQTVTFHALGTRSISSAGVVTAADTETSVSALKREVAGRNLSNAGGILKIGDTMWEVPNTVTPVVGDMIEEADGTMWRVIWVDEKPVLSMWRAYARK